MVVVHSYVLLISYMNLGGFLCDTNPHIFGDMIFLRMSYSYEAIETFLIRFVGDSCLVP